MILDKPAQVERMQICKNCEFVDYTAKRPTCGKPIIGNIVEYEGNKYRTCGCFLDVKIKFSASACPLGKWGNYKSEKDTLDQARELLEQLKATPGRITQAQRQQLNKIYPALIGRKSNVSQCPPCIRSAVKELEEYLSYRPKAKRGRPPKTQENENFKTEN